MKDYRNIPAQELIAHCLSTQSAIVWEEFLRRFQPLIAGVVARTARRWVPVTATIVDDLVQETLLKLCTEEFRRLRDFQSRHEDAIYGYLKAVAYTVTLDYFKVHYAAKRGAKLRTDGDFEDVARVEGKESSVENDVLQRELDQMALDVAEGDRDRLVFYLYYRQGFTTNKIAQIPGIGLSQKGVESCLHRLTERLKKKVVGEAH